MVKANIAITIDERMVGGIDRLVRQKAFFNRSQAIETAIQEQRNRMDRCQLALESSQLSSKHEQAMTDEGTREDAKSWPVY
jgi:metal-responsive CopG/Arc/MetJ family transcriptional regulator